MSEYPDQLWRSVADLSGLLLSEESLETTLRRVTDLAVRAIPHCDAVGVTLVQDGVATTRAATGGQIYEVDHYQYDIGEGPCLSSALEQVVVEVQDMGTDVRWPRFARHAAERGIYASLSFPLLVRGVCQGALNLYSHRTGAFTAEDRSTGTMFASQAGVALANAQTYAASIALAGQLREALDSRAVIDQALGILMGQNGYNQEAAFAALRVVSQGSNRKLKHVAEEIVKSAVSRPTSDPGGHDAPDEPGERPS